mgnify:CR=1 FL=1
MRYNDEQDKQSLTPMQKQAVLVCAVCALAALLTISITLVMLKRGKTPVDQPTSSTSQDVASSGEDISDHYQINEASSALLTETADAGSSYQDQTLFLGDSNTVRLYANGLISLQQFCAKEGIGTAAALNEGIVTFKRDDNRYTIAQAVAKMKPRRVVIMLGTNDNGMAVEDFIKNYTALVQAIQDSYPYTDIIVNTIPPIPQNHANYPSMEQTKIDDFNMALLSMCEQMGLKFLNSAEVLKDDSGYGNPDYYQSGDIHLKPAGLKQMLNYLRTHAYESEDRRPDTSNIPTRAEYTANPSYAVEDPSSSEAAASSEEAAQYQASYRVDKTGGGTLTIDGKSGRSLTVDVTDASQKVSVTAEPDEGYVFVKWSDGVTQKTRTDTNFKQNVDVTAVFAAASIQISGSGKATLGSSYTFKAALKGKYLETSSIHWYANGVEVPEADGKTAVKVSIDSSMLGTTFHVYATASYNGCTVTSNKLEVEVSNAASSSSSTSGSSSSSSTASSSSKEDNKEEKPATSDSNGASSSSSSHSTAASSSHSSVTSSSASSKKEEKPASHSTAASSSHSSATSSSASSKKEEKPASSNSTGSSSASSKPASSKTETAVSSKPASSKAETTASSKSETAASSKEQPAFSKTEASASREASSEKSAS